MNVIPAIVSEEQSNIRFIKDAKKIPGEIKNMRARTNPTIISTNLAKHPSLIGVRQ
jgi:hypothetical protein